MAQKIIAGVLLVIAGLVFAAYSLVWWTERQILNSDSWVNYSSQLPKNPAIANALATRVTDQIFSDVPVEQKIAEALPPRASFLAAPLTSQIQNQTINIVTKIIEGDTFQSIWTGANRLAIDRILTQARQDNPSTSDKISEKFNINLSSIQPLIQSRLGGNSPISPALQEGGQKVFEVATDLKVAREHIRSFVRTTDSLYAVLPAAFAASFLGFMAFTTDRRRSLIILAVLAIVLLLVELIAIRYGRQQILSRVENSQYIPAVSDIYDSLMSGLRQLIGWLIAFWAVIAALALAAGNSAWAITLRKSLRLYDLSDVRLIYWFRKARAYIARYRFIVWGAIVAIGLLYLALIGSVTNIALINSILISLSLIFFVQILSDMRVAAAVQPAKNKTNRK